jgi:TP901 family phage tail tape measure protein
MEVQMSLGDVIARLAVNLTMDTGEFLAGSTKAQGALGKLQTQMQSLGDRWMETGKKLSTRVSLPIAGLGAGIIKIAADFESGMNKVAISTKAPAAEFEGLRKLAIKIGKDTTFGATEASDAMDMLAKNGLTAKQILDGAATAAVNLASAAGSDLSPAANAITDVMQQFKLTAGQLPGVVDQITGAVNESKLDFVDFAGAISQAGGVAASSGVSFKDFNAVIAGTSSLFASGSDAGTSFKTFIVSLVPQSKAAAKAMEQYGLSFYDAQGNMKSMGEIADTLKQKLGGLSEQDRTGTLKTIFGVDAMRTAIGLMDLGADGLDKISGRIAKTDAAAQSAARLKGFTGQLENLKGAIETLAIAIADTGLLTAITRVVTGLANFISRLAETNPFLIKLAVGVVALTAVMGPLMLVVGTLAATLLPLFLARLSPIGLAIAAFINPVGTLVAVLSRMALSFGGLTILQTLAPMLLRFLGPVGLIASAGVLIYQNWDKIGPIFAEFWTQAQQALGPPLQELLATITGAFSELWNGPLGEGIRSVIATITSFQSAVGSAFGALLLGSLKLVLSAFTEIIKTVGTGIQIINAALNGDWSKAWTLAAGLVTRLMGGLPEFVIGAMQRMVTGVRSWIVDKLGAIWKGAIDKIETVRKAFYNLADAVVFHSYIPDMVDGIEAQMKRLDTVMVDKAKAATSKTAKHFFKLRDDLKDLTARLFPEIAAREKVRKEDALIGEGVSAGALTGDEGAELRRRLAIESGAGDAAAAVGSAFGGGFAAIGDSLGDFVGNVSDAAHKIAENNANVAQSFMDMAQSTLSSLQGLTNAIKSGGFLDILSSVIDVALQVGGSGLFGGKKIAAHATGTSYAGRGLALVGERGPELVNLRGGESIYSNANSRALMGGNRTVNNYYTLPSDQFWGAVDGRAASVAAPMSAASGMHARSAAGADLARAQRRRIP